MQKSEVRLLFIMQCHTLNRGYMYNDEKYAITNELNFINMKNVKTNVATDKTSIAIIIDFLLLMSILLETSCLSLKNEINIKQKYLI